MEYIMLIIACALLAIGWICIIISSMYTMQHRKTESIFFTSGIILLIFGIMTMTAVAIRLYGMF
jgi:uncharacterized membrane protein HdeD (DUF308 family)